jgi:hypothetical protein
MRRPLPAAVLLVLLSLALAGCSVDTHRPKDGDDGSSSGDGGDGDSSDDGSSAGPEEDSAVFQVTVSSDGAAVVEVPFPTLDSCRSPEHWMEGQPSVQGAIPELREVTGDRTGKVLALSTRAQEAEWWVQIAPGPTCQTFRYDPWSIEPDADNGTLEVRVTQGQVANVTVLVRQVRDGVGHATRYEGTPSGNGWTALPATTSYTF